MQGNPLATSLRTKTALRFLEDFAALYSVPVTELASLKAAVELDGLKSAGAAFSRGCSPCSGAGRRRTPLRTFATSL